MADLAFLRRLVTSPNIVYEDLYVDHLSRSIANWQWDSIEKNSERQKRALFNTLNYALKNIQYYKHLAKDINFTYSKDSIFEDLARFPVLTKKDIRGNFSKLVNKKYLKRSKLNSSGGTTGEPIKIYQHERNLKLVNIINSLQYSWTGLGKGDMFVQLWGDESEIFKYGDNASGIIPVADKHYILNSFKMSEEKMRSYVQFINYKKPKLILSYVQSIYELSKYIQKTKLKIECRPRIMTSAGTLHSFQKQLIENVFNTKVFNRYGSREVHTIACDCEKHEGLHLNTYLNYLEILDDKLMPVTKENQKGKVYITTFENPVMPLIRYEIGDIATYTRKACSCRRGLPVIKEINGRVVDIFINQKGEKIDGEYFTHLFYLKRSIEKFQVIQRSKSLIEVNHTSGNDVSKKTKISEFKEIDNKIRLVMGDKCKVKYLEVKDISPTKSGKIRYTISQLS